MASGGYTYIQMQKLVRLAVRRGHGEDARYVDDLVPYFVNDAYLELDRKLRWTRCTYTLTLAQSDNEYDIPSSVREYLAVLLTDEDGNVKRLEALSLDEWIDRRAQRDAESEPNFYIQHGDRFYLYPTPDTSGETVTIYVVGEPPALSDDSDKPGFPVHLHQLIVTMALAHIDRHLGNVELATQQEAYVEMKIGREVKDAAMKRGGSGRVKTFGP
ncbi:MAG TPA: hypothetical protein VMW94_06410 [Actinomycetes bacterium]|nr:hypothetical protein [Actinomycetes bacterium]